MFLNIRHFGSKLTEGVVDNPLFFIKYNFIYIVGEIEISFKLAIYVQMQSSITIFISILEKECT
jgi:hypothetical protein